MTKFRLGTVVMGAALTTLFASHAFAIDSKASCEYEGGEAFTIAGDLVCVVPIRAEEFHGEEYDDAQLGVKECEGDLIGDGVFCKIMLIEGKKKVSAPEQAVEAKMDDTKKEVALEAEDKEED